MIEIQGVENGKLAVPVKTLVHHTAFLAAETQPCVLILKKNYNRIWLKAN